MANVFQIKRRAANAPAFDPTRMDLSQSGGSDRGYKIGEKVTYNGSTYVALHNNDAISPTSAEYWQNLNISLNAAGAPDSLFNGEMAFNEVNQTLYYGKADASIEAIDGEGSFASLYTNQTITGDKAFTANVILSSATASTLVRTASSDNVATTAFVQDVFSVIDGGDFDGAVYVPSVVIGKYFYSPYNDYDRNKWNNVLSWWGNSNHTVQATVLPTSATDVVVLSPVAPIVDLDRQDWVQPNLINSGSTGITFTSQLSGNVSCDIIGNATFLGNSTFNK